MAPLAPEDVERLAIADVPARPVRGEHASSHAVPTRSRSEPATSGGPSGAPSGWPSSISDGVRWHPPPAGWRGRSASSATAGSERVEAGYLHVAARLPKPRDRRPGLRPDGQRTSPRPRHAVRAIRTSRAGTGGHRRVPDRARRRRSRPGPMDEVMVGVTSGEVSPVIVGHRVLLGHRLVPAGLRPAPGAGVDDGARPLVRVAAAARALPGTVPAEPRRDHAVPRCLGGRRGRGPTGQ